MKNDGIFMTSLSMKMMKKKKKKGGRRGTCLSKTTIVTHIIVDGEKYKLSQVTQFDDSLPLLRTRSLLPKDRLNFCFSVKSTRA